MNIRKAAASDVAEIRRCAVSAYSKYIERIGKPPAPMVADFEASVKDGHVVVAECDDQVAGFVVHYVAQDAMHLENVAVYPVYAGRGIGRMLINYVQSRASALGLSWVELYTNAAMTENLAMYPALGFEEYDRRTEHGFDRVYFRIQV